MSANSTKYNAAFWIEVSFRAVLGGAFIWAGIAKLLDIDELVRTIGNFTIEPFNEAPYDMWLGYTLPALEVIIGTCLILGVLYRGALISYAALTVSFTVAIAYVANKGIDIKCGCFGKAFSFDNYTVHLLILAAMLSLTISLIWMEMTRRKHTI